MKYPRCREEMEEGYLSLISTSPSGIYWSKVEPPGFWAPHFLAPKGGIAILQRAIYNWKKGDWLRRAYRCEKCGLIFFEEKYTLSSEEKKS